MTAPAIPTVEDLPLGRLHEWERNPRRISKPRLEALKRALVAEPEMLRARPLIALPDGTVVAGNQRLRAARELGWPSLPVVVVDLDEGRAAEWALRDNRGYGEDDEALVGALLAELAADGRALDLTGYDSGEVDRLLAAVRPVPVVDPDDAPPLPAEPRSVRGEVYELGPHRLMCGDATSERDMETLIGDARAALVFTSPPYAVGLEYSEYIDSLPNLRLLLLALATTWRDALAEGGFCIVNFGDVISGSGHAGVADVCEYPMALEHWPIFRRAGWLLHTRRVWAKPHARVAAPWTASSNRAASDWEHLWTWKLPGPTLNERRSPSYLGVWDTSHGETVDVGKDIHPSAFPSLLVRWVLTVYTDHADGVADPFAGTGTTMIACEQLGRRALCMEIDPGYCDVIRQRYADFTGQPDLAP